LDSRIRRVISRLDEQSNRERRGEADVAPGQEMLAITADTGAFFSILLKAIRAKSVLEIGTSAGFSTLWFAGGARQQELSAGQRWQADRNN
jgi:caffeoyl-CoA O-methyltransferase